MMLHQLSTATKPSRMRDTMRNRRFASDDGTSFESGPAIPILYLAVALTNRVSAASVRVARGVLADAKRRPPLQTP